MPTEETTAREDSGASTAASFYPAGATTNSDSGVTNIRRIDAVLERMAERDLPLLVHGEVRRATWTSSIASIVSSTRCCC